VSRWRRTAQKWAKADLKRRFHSLRDKVYREDVPQRAWYAVRWNNGAPDIDKATLAAGAAGRG
jgi:hypothetical protein